MTKRQQRGYGIIVLALVAWFIAHTAPMTATTVLLVTCLIAAAAALAFGRSERQS